MWTLPAVSFDKKKDKTYTCTAFSPTRESWRGRGGSSQGTAAAPPPPDGKKVKRIQQKLQPTLLRKREES